jgi:hypothetical protein
MKTLVKPIAFAWRVAYMKNQRRKLLKPSTMKTHIETTADRTMEARSKLDECQQSEAKARGDYESAQAAKSRATLRYYLAQRATECAASELQAAQEAHQAARARSPG